MIKYKNKIGYIVYEVTAAECYSWGGLSICDNCNTFSSKGYLIPVLNYFMCPSCYRDWVSCAKFHPEDLDFERYNCNYYESILPFVVTSDEV